MIIALALAWIAARLASAGGHYWSMRGERRTNGSVSPTEATTFSGNSWPTYRRKRRAFGKADFVRARLSIGSL